jgi:hypothetical protein
MLISYGSSIELSEIKKIIEETEQLEQ